jgi:hypothetical protein
VRNPAAIAALAALLLAPACAADREPLEYLDPDTGATVTVVAQPLVFANQRTGLAANARDYVTLAGAAVNRGGKVTYVGIAYFWSSVDPQMLGAPLPAPEPLILQADDRRLELRLQGQSARDAGIGAVQPPTRRAAGPPSVYGLDLATLRFIAEARQLTVLAESNGTLLPYPLWEDRRAALRSFVRHMSGSD